MQTLTWADHRKISEFVRDLYCLDSVKAIFERVVQRLDTLIGGNSTIMILNESKADAPRILAENAGRSIKNCCPQLGRCGTSILESDIILLIEDERPLADLLPLNQ